MLKLYTVLAMLIVGFSIFNIEENLVQFANLYKNAYLTNPYNI